MHTSSLDGNSTKWKSHAHVVLGWQQHKVDKSCTRRLGMATVPAYVAGCKNNVCDCVRTSVYIPACVRRCVCVGVQCVCMCVLRSEGGGGGRGCVRACHTLKSLGHNL